MDFSRQNSMFPVKLWLPMEHTTDIPILQHQKKFQRIRMSDRPAICKTDLILYCNKPVEATPRPRAKHLALKHFWVVTNGQTNGLIQLQPHICKGTGVLARKSKPHQFHYIAIIVKIGPPMAGPGCMLWGPFLVWYLRVPIGTTKRVGSPIQAIFISEITLQYIHTQCCRGN